jgi:hypothetical protein
MGLPKPMGQAGWAGQLPKACRAQAQGPLVWHGPDKGLFCTRSLFHSILLRSNSMLVSGIHIGVNLRAKDWDENE